MRQTKNRKHFARFDYTTIILFPKNVVIAVKVLT